MPGLVEIRPQNQSPSTEPPERPTPLDDHLLHFRRRVLADALLEGTAAYWHRRGDAFATVGTPECDQVALACHRKADLMHDIGLDAEAEYALDILTGVTRSLLSPLQLPPGQADEVQPWA